jgi:VanZ family protein
MIEDHRFSRRAGVRISTAILCIAISLGLLFVGLWPFRFRPANNVHRIAGQPGLRFDKYGIVVGEEPLFTPGGAIDLTRPFTLRMDLLSSEEPSRSIPRILSAHDEEGRELFFLGQWRDALILRILEGERTFRPRYRETGASGLQKDVKRSIIVRSEDRAVTLFIDGEPARTRSGVDFSLLSDRRGPTWVILGNSPAGGSPWRGDLLSLSIYPIALSPRDIESRERAPLNHYDFSEGNGAVCRGSADPRRDLSIPAVFRAPAKGVLVPPWKEQEYNRSFWNDMFVNVLGFIPLGFAVFAWTDKDGARKNATATGITLLLGAGISLFIELLQVYLPSRDSSLTDVMNNILGTYIGARLFRTVHDILFH